MAKRPYWVKEQLINAIGFLETGRAEHQEGSQRGSNCRRNGIGWQEAPMASEALTQLT
jgi:hypothetical protein